MACEHNWINEFGDPDWYAKVTFGFEDGDVIFIGRKCTICGKREKRSVKFVPWKNCFFCVLGEMHKVEEFGRVFKCNNCGRTWPPER